MKVTDLLIGKRINYMTDARVMVELEIKEAKEERHSRDLEPPTRENDWYPPSEDWTTIEVLFTTGFRKSYSSLSEIDIIPD
jgi:hypothetical protein